MKDDKIKTILVKKLSEIYDTFSEMKAIHNPDIRKDFTDEGIDKWFDLHLRKVLFSKEMINELVSVVDGYAKNKA